MSANMSGLHKTLLLIDTYVLCKYKNKNNIKEKKE